MKVGEWWKSKKDGVRLYLKQYIGLDWWRIIIHYPDGEKSTPQLTSGDHIYKNFYKVSK